MVVATIQTCVYNISILTSVVNNLFKLALNMKPFTSAPAVS